MAHLNRLSALVLVGLFATAWAARADGPHWQVPNPDGEDESSVDNEGKKPDAPVTPPKPGKNPLAGVGGGGAGAGQADYMKNPGNFMTMDQPCIDYYGRHSVIQFKGKGGQGPAADTELGFYLLIMNRCAQAMREVDNYLPCPDSFPLWHSEELRELMLEFSQRTWVRSTQLKPEYAKACADFCVQCFVDTVRFKTPGKDNAGEKFKKAFEGNKKLQELLEQMDKEPNATKKQAIWKECTGVLNGSGLSAGLSKALLTFKLITGDIPPQVDDAEARMMLALVNMGSIVLPPLQAAAKNGNPDVQRSVFTVIDMIQRRFAKPDMLAASMSNVIQVLRDIQTKPGTAEAANAAKVLKNMGNAALPYLIKVAESDTLDLKNAAFGALQMISGKSFGPSLAKWKEYVASLEAPPAPAKPKEEPQKAVEEKKPPKPVAEQE